MCGICGICQHAGGGVVDESVLRAMTDRMAHRGPDDDGLLLDGRVGLGVRRLSIIDLITGAQPICSEDASVAAVVNGEIYNFRALRAELEGLGHRFATRADSEVVVHAYEEWGAAALRRLNGMFGLAVWDRRRGELLLARDPFGIKPLYYADDGRTLVFASEIRSLLRHPSVRRDVDPAAVRAYVELTYVPSPRTAFAGIHKLAPGHALLWSEREPRLQTMAFHEPASAEPLDVAPRELEELLAAELRDAVVRQSVADVPIGVLLSGGVDSTAVASIVAAETGRLETFTVGFGDRFRHDERDAARRTALRLGSAHHEVVLSARDYLDLLPAAVRYVEEPVSNPSAVPFMAVSGLASASVKVVLTGQGADESFAGYARHLAERYGGGYRALPGIVRDRVVAPLAGRVPRAEWLKRAVHSVEPRDAAVRFRRLHSILDERLARELVRGDVPPGDEALAGWHAEAASLDGLNRLLYVDARTVLADNLLVFGDKVSMAGSLEARMPFLDLRLMAIVERIPAHFKIRGATRKWILRRAVRRWVPADVLRRPKIGLVTPVDAWFRNGMRPMLTERLLGQGSACREWFAPEVMRRLVDEHAEGTHDHKRLLFGLLAFELWHEELVRAPRSTL